jgi:hypothetical protein
MNCQSCNTRIDYRFITNCTHCGCEVPRVELTQLDPLSKLPSLDSSEKAFTWKQRLLNLAYVFVSSVAGMISGSAVVYFVGGMAYLVLFSGVGNPSEACARGNLVGLLLILVGAYLGTVGGSVFAIKNPLCKGR